VHTVTSFHASALPADQLSAIMADYLALEQVRVFRRLLMVRCGLMALLIGAGLGSGWLPLSASVFGVSLFLGVPVVVWVLECQRARRLAHRLEHVPGREEHVVHPPPA